MALQGRQKVRDLVVVVAEGIAGGVLAQHHLGIGEAIVLDLDHAVETQLIGRLAASRRTMPGPIDAHGGHSALPGRDE